MAIWILRRLRIVRSWRALARRYSKARFEVIPSEVLVEEETLRGYKRQDYYPANIGQVFEDRYQIIGKLGFGAHSTVWLCRDLSNKTYNALKILTASPEFPDIKQQEPSVYQHLSAIRSEHPGKNNTRALLDTFTVKGPQMEHQCLVQQPMFMTIWHYERLYGQPLKVSWIKDILRSLLRALDFLHTEAQVIHTDIKTDNIMKSLEDQSVLNQFAEEENHEPTSRKIVDQNLTIYKSRQIQWPRRTGNWVLCDFGSAVIGKVQEAGTYCQPDAYRAPEVVFKMQWGPKIDIWNLGCLAWELVERKVLFRGIRLDDKTYHPYLHVARMVALLGEPPEQFVARNQHTLECFWEDGEWRFEEPAVPSDTMESLATRLNGQEKQDFLVFIRTMLRWLPEERLSARELLQHPWLKM